MEFIKIAGVFLMALINISFGTHYRGGTISWKPIGNNQIELNYKVGFKLDYSDPGFDPCTPEALFYRTELDTRGKLMCDSCNEDEKEKKLRWICDDYDVTGDYAVGHNNLVYNIPIEKQELDIEYEGCCWVDLVSPDNKPGGARGWKMLAHVNMQPRPDNGLINSSPVSLPMPLERYQKGCEYLLRIRVSDPDGDAIRCRYADKSKDECPRDGITRACGPPTDGVTINKKYCTMSVNTKEVAEGYHAVNLIIEDYIRPVKRKSEPLSKTSLQFLLLVEGGDEECTKPKIIDPPTCEAVRPGEHFELVIHAEAGSPSKPISTISTQKPFGMTSSVLENYSNFPGRKQVTLSWDPTEEDIGEHSLCFSALDSERFTSGTSCTFIYVDNNPLQVYPEGSIPAINEEFEVGKAVIVQFNKKIKRPKISALIQFIDAKTGEIAFQIDSKDPAVLFDDTRLEIFPPKEALISDNSVLVKEFEIVINEGVALPKGNGCASLAAQWPIVVINVDNQPPILSGIPQDLVRETDPGLPTATVTWPNPTASDNSASVTVTSSHTSGDSFRIGDTLVTYTATDSSSTFVTANFTVTVRDTEKPTFSDVPENILQSTDPGSDTATVFWSDPTALDNSGSVTLSSNYMPGDSFLIGEHVIEYTAVDPYSNEATVSFTITIEDLEDPVIESTPDILQPTDPGSDEAVVFWLEPTASDNSKSVTLSSSHQTGDSFPIGETVVTYTAVDPYLNEVTESFTITIQDLEDPVIENTPKDILQSTDPGSDEAVVFWFEPTASDNSKSVTLSSSHQPGDSFPIGETVVTYTAMDPYLNDATESFTITIQDLEDPVIESTPKDILQSTDPGSDEAVVFWLEPTASDNSKSVTLSSSHQPGDSFPIGETVVTYTAVDPYLNEATEAFTITIQDLEDPVIENTSKDILQSTDPGSDEAVVFWLEPTASDNSKSVTLSSSHQPGDSFPIGETVVTYKAVDPYLNEVTESFTITIQDLEPPTISDVQDITQDVDVDSNTAIVNWTEPIASDNSKSVTVTSSHSPGDTFQIGNTTVTYTAEDPYGNTATSSFVVTVLDKALPAKFPEPAKWILERPKPFQCSSVDFDLSIPYHVALDGDECFVHLDDSHVTVTNGLVTINAQICCEGACKTAPLSESEVN